MAGTEKGKRGKIIEDAPFGKERAIVEGIKMIKRHTRKKPGRTPRCAIIEREGTVPCFEPDAAPRSSTKNGRPSEAEPEPATA